MRTTLAINDDLLAQAKEQARVRGLSLGAYVDQALREYLTAPARPAEQVSLPVAAAGGLHAGIDPSSSRALYEVIDDAGELPK